MRNVLPQQAGLTVSQVIYQYSTIKETEDDMIVHVQNENARGPGYIFRSSDDWSGIPGNSIKKAVPVDAIDISYWGPGSIEVEGTGEVNNAGVFYTYKYDPCFDPQSNPKCPGYQDPFVIELTEVEIVDPLDDDLIQDELDRKAMLDAQEEDDEERERKEALEKKEKVEKTLEALEDLLGTINTTELKNMAIIQHQILANLNQIPNAYYSSLVGGSYPDSVVLDGGDLPTNKRGLRQGMAQQLLHQELVKLQYERK